jgi:hypothetical protein
VLGDGVAELHGAKDATAGRARRWAERSAKLPAHGTPCLIYALDGQPG